eukprot:scaffold2284_cov234-Chaetoceros_neogracile.AAC.2
MGVKGLYSLISNEPTRFGGRILISQKTDVDIYIDAPALHHHLIHCLQRKINLPPSLNLRDLDTSTIGITSPCTIFQLTNAFVGHLLDSINPNSTIHCIFDGVASRFKEKQQLERIQNSCSTFDQAARSFVSGERGKSYHIPHLFGEDALREAVQFQFQLQEGAQSSRLFVHFAESEAESFIANMMNIPKSEHESVDRDTIVLSNDSDFLVFPSVASFVPLHSLEYATLDDGESSSALMGWNYTKKQFIAAHLHLEGSDDDDSFCVMTAMAALAGCDYTLSTTLQRRISAARNVIVNSNISGLRQRDRNDPTARSALLAVLRYISHFRRDQDEDWLSNMAQSIASAEGGKDIAERKCEFLEALSAIRHVYAGTDDRGNQRLLENTKCGSGMVDLKRLLLQRKLYCKPVMEICEGARQQISDTRKSKNKKRKKGTLSLESCSEDRACDGGSLWMQPVFVECRDRIYTFIAHKYREVGENEIVSITEHCRSGGSNQLSYKDYHAGVKRDNGQQSFHDFSFHQTILYLIGRSTNYQSSFALRLAGLPVDHQFAFFASLLMKSRKNALMLITLIFAPKVSVPVPIHKQKEFHTILPWKEYMEASGRIQIALHHTALVIDAAVAFCDVERKDMQEMPYFSPSKTLCDERLLAIWSIVELSKDDQDDHVLGTIKGQWNRSFRTQDRDWSENMDTIWKFWVEHQKPLL